MNAADGTDAENGSDRSSGVDSVIAARQENVAIFLKGIRDGAS